MKAVREKHNEQAEREALAETMNPAPPTNMPETENIKILEKCSGVQIRQMWITACVEGCGGNDICGKGCSCLREKLGRIDDAVLGKLMAQVQMENPAAKAEFNGIVETCNAMRH